MTHQHFLPPLMVSIFYLITAAYGQTNSTLTNGLVAFYKFDSKIVDSSSQENNLEDPQGSFDTGELSFGADRFGIPASALHISNAYVQLRSLSNIGITGNQDVTISVWIKPLSDMEGIWIAGFGSLDSPMGAFAMSMKETYPAPRAPAGMSVFNYLPAGQGGAVADGIRGDFGFVLSSWHHLVAVYSGILNSISIYLDGQLLSTSNYVSSQNSNTLKITSTPLFVGVQPDQDIAGNMKGALDDLAIYSRALSSSEVVDLYQAQSPTGDPDNDGVNNYREIADGTDPNDPNSFNPLSRGLAAYYPFDGNPNDESGNGDHGTIVGSPTLTWDRFGRSNSAYRFDDGSNNIKTTGKFLPRSSEPRTLSAWVRTDVVPASPIIRIPLAWGANADNQAFGLIMGPTVPAVWGVQFWGGGQDVMTDILVEEGWRHLVAAYDGEVIDLFLNGERYLTQNKSTTTGPGGLSIGAGIESFLGSLETAFIGAVDDVRIYNDNLSESEVKQLYFHEAFDGLQKQFIETNPSSFGLFNLTQYNASRKQGQTDVTTNPAAFNMFTRSQYNASFVAGRSAGRADVKNKPSAHGLVARSSIPTVRVATKQGNKVSVSLPGSWTRYAQSGMPRGWKFNSKTGALDGVMPQKVRPSVRLTPYKGNETGAQITIQFQPTAR
jgi:hypothetical protein